MKHIPAGDRETHARVLHAASRLFAARGFEHVTVREICAAADANVAAVNYHFGDKLGLYRQVLEKAIGTMSATTAAAIRAGTDKAPEDRLREYVRVFLQRVTSGRQDSWIHQLMAHELADPTPALTLVYEEVVRPRLTYVSEIVSEMLGRPTDDEGVIQCVLSIQAQCHAAMSLSRRLFPELPDDAAAVERLAFHIAEFSLAGIRASAGEHRAVTVGRRRR